MKNDLLLKEALHQVPNRALLINMVARRVRQLITGARPMVKSNGMGNEGIALKEIAEGKLEPRSVERGDELVAEITG